MSRVHVAALRQGSLDAGHLGLGEAPAEVAAQDDALGRVGVVAGSAGKAGAGVAARRDAGVRLALEVVARAARLVGARGPELAAGTRIDGSGVRPRVGGSGVGASVARATVGAAVPWGAAVARSVGARIIAVSGVARTVRRRVHSAGVVTGVGAAAAGVAAARAGEPRGEARDDDACTASLAGRATGARRRAMSRARHARSRLAGPAIMAVLGLVLASGTTLSMAFGRVQTGWLLIGWMTLAAVGVGLAGFGAVTVVVRLLSGDRSERR